MSWACFSNKYHCLVCMAPWLRSLDVKLLPPYSLYFLSPFFFLYLIWVLENQLLRRCRRCGTVYWWLHLIQCRLWLKSLERKTRGIFSSVLNLRLCDMHEQFYVIHTSWKKCELAQILIPQLCRGKLSQRETVGQGEIDKNTFFWLCF